MSDRSRQVMIVEDERDVREPLAEYLRGVGFDVVTAADGQLALALLGRQSIDVVVSDIQMPNMGGMELFSVMRAEYPLVDVVFFTAFGTVEMAVNSIKAGACDYILKPVVFEDIQHKLERIFLARTGGSEEVDKADGAGPPSYLDRIVGGSLQINRLKKLVKQVAKAGSYALIEGESGTGKELVARALHECSSRKKNPFVAVNCAAIPEHLLEAEFFGYTRGSFTGAVADKKGYFESAHGGTLFLDEILELPMAMQAKLLRAVEELEITPIGKTVPIIVDVVVIAASAKDLRREVEAGSFRDDLFYRINVVDINVPPLRKRKEDIPTLARHFLIETKKRMSSDVTDYSPETLAVLENYDWPGNIRELRNVVERAIVMTQGSLIGVESLPGYLSGGDLASNLPTDYRSVVKDFERDLIIRTLKDCDNDKKLAAEVLGIGLSSLYRKLDDLDLD